MMTAEEFFLTSLAFKTDPSDLSEARMKGEAPVVVDVRNQASWDQGHIPNALHIPRADLADRIAQHVPDKSSEIVLYCWGPGCNGSTKAALDLARMGYTNLKELLGGYEYWAKEGLAIETARGRTRRPVDDLTAPV
ncbi:rhodanese-like domain-containing protein [Nesterenkonia muleiensis]|uniref:rhodanese-like domain-containing protein n=1 Tax=Nesterenkonia muleiensis TaxID=2282648 RepID=UPI000E734167|nr:rhodanese-like domain-containing protein [Nesterenkonia muleiensis]